MDRQIDNSVEEILNGNMPHLAVINVLSNLTDYQIHGFQNTKRERFECIYISIDRNICNKQHAIGTDN